MNQYSNISSLLISRSFLFEEVFCLILASSQRKIRGYVEFLKFYVTIKKIKNSNSSKIRGLDHFLVSFVWNITSYWCIRARNWSLITRSLHKIDHLKQILKKSKSQKKMVPSILAKLNIRSSLSIYYIRVQFQNDSLNFAKFRANTDIL